MQNESNFKTLKELDAYFDAQLRDLHSSQARRADRYAPKVNKWLLRLCLLMILLVLPFLVLIRTSLYLYGTYGMNGWLALGGGVAVTVLLLLAYVWVVNHLYVKTRLNGRWLIKGISFLVVAYCCYGLLYLSGVNAKSEEVRSYYRSLHPILRVALATTTLADQQLVVTDTQRSREDYLDMGLPVNERSLHYIQKSGYVHAVDVRTRGRAEWKNWLTMGLFRLTGLELYRHVGTADHLHVFIPVN